jgi:hypothetical protein
VILDFAQRLRHNPLRMRPVASLPLFEPGPPPPSRSSPAAITDLASELCEFHWRGTPTRVDTTRAVLPAGKTIAVQTFVNEFWTSRQRAAHSLHEVSYRACFKPQLPRFFIERLTAPGDVVYDPFMGRGTTPIEAALLGRVPIGCDINPLSLALVGPRLRPPALPQVRHALHGIDFHSGGAGPPDLLAFYHPQTLREICALRHHLLAATERGALSEAEAWIRMVALNRLTGHSRGFFSVYTLPPNQATSVVAQRKINERRGQEPPWRDVPALILAKTRALLQDCDEVTRETLRRLSSSARLLVGDAAHSPDLQDGSIDLVVTSPPFLDVVNYAVDNWLRCWFHGIDATGVPVSIHRRLDAWEAFIGDVFRELSRVLRRGGHVAFEVGEVRGGQVHLETSVIAAAVSAGLTPVLVLVNAQRFTKTANCWGVSNNDKGTNTNRIVVVRKD